MLLLFVSCQLSAQSATVNNNTDCDMDIIFGGVELCAPCTSATTTYAHNSSVTSTISGNGCNIDELVAANVTAVSFGSGNVTVKAPACSGCGPGTTQSGTFWVPAGGCYTFNQQIKVVITCNNTDVTIDIYEI